MRLLNTNRFFLCGLALASIIFLSGSLACAERLGQIRMAIGEKGARWVAEETAISVLPDYERKAYFGLIMPETKVTEKVMSLQVSTMSLPSKLDWRSNKGSYVTPVKNQGSGICGSCWAFATVAALESNILIRNKQSGIDDDRAEQILVACSGAGSCSGGNIDEASDYIRDFGTPPEPYFPYTASSSDDKCSNALPGWDDYTSRITSWSWVTTTDPVSVDAIKQSLNTHGPLVATMIVHNDFNYYAGGIYEYITGSYEGGHAVLIVGYVDDQSVPGGGYFIVKNSWGNLWGEAGYFNIAYSQSGFPVYFGRWTIAYENQSFSVNPSYGTIGTEITLTGSSFGTKKGTATIGGKACKISVWTDELITCEIHKAHHPTTHDVIVKRKEFKDTKHVTSQQAFVVIAPQIISAESNSGSEGALIQVTGNHFGSKKGKVYLEHPVTKKKKSCKIMSWKMDSITFIVPKISRSFPPETYHLVVKNKIGITSASNGFTVNP